MRSKNRLERRAGTVSAWIAVLAMIATFAAPVSAGASDEEAAQSSVEAGDSDGNESAGDDDPEAADDSGQEPLQVEDSPPEPIIEQIVIEETGEEVLISPEDLTPTEVLEAIEPENAARGWFPPNSPPVTTWRPCGIWDGEDKFVADYVRLRVQSRQVGSVADFRCGTDRWGYRHVLTRNHDDDWRAKAAAVEGVQWRDLADWGMAWALQDPDVVTWNSSASSYCYSRQISVYRKKDGKLVLRTYARVGLGTTARRIITVFPQAVQCKGTNLVR